MSNMVVERMPFSIVYLGDDILMLQALIDDCEGKHVQQVSYSTHHKALTQLCFGCQAIRTTMPMTTDATDLTSEHKTAKPKASNQEGVKEQHE